jgi:hypothetical protein
MLNVSLDIVHIYLDMPTGSTDTVKDAQNMVTLSQDMLTCSQDLVTFSQYVLASHHNVLNAPFVDMVNVPRIMLNSLWTYTEDQ